MANFKNEILSKLGVSAAKYASLTQFRLGSFVGKFVSFSFYGLCLCGLIF